MQRPALQFAPKFGHRIEQTEQKSASKLDKGLHTNPIKFISHLIRIGGLGAVSKGCRRPVDELALGHRGGRVAGEGAEYSD